MDLQGEKELSLHTHPITAWSPRHCWPLPELSEMLKSSLLFREGTAAQSTRWHPTCIPPTQGKSSSTTRPAGRNPRAPAGAWRILGCPSWGEQRGVLPPHLSAYRGVPEAGSSELGDISHHCPPVAWPGRRTRHPQGTWGQTWGQHLQARPEMLNGRISRDKVATIRAGTRQCGTGEDNQPAVGRGWAHRAVGAVSHITGVEGEDGSPGTHVEDAPIVLQQQGAVVEGVHAEAPDARQLCKGNGELRGDPRAGTVRATRRRQRMEPGVGGKAPTEVIRQMVPAVTAGGKGGEKAHKGNFLPLIRTAAQGWELQHPCPAWTCHTVWGTGRGSENTPAVTPAPN